MKLRGSIKGLSPAAIGAVFVVVTLMVGWLMFNKSRVRSWFESGKTFHIEFANAYPYYAYNTDVKISGVPIGKVTGVHRTATGAEYTVKVKDDVPPKLRLSPTAAMRPTTLLGGRYYIDLVPGGAPGTFHGDIPESRTTIPVELDAVLESLDGNTLDSVQRTAVKVDKTLNSSNQAAIRQLLADAPTSLHQAAPVLSAMQGTRPRTDLSRLVSGAQSLAEVLTRQEGQLESIVVNLGRTSDAFGERAGALSATLSDLPGTMDATKAGMARLDTSLGKLRETAGALRPVAPELDKTLRDLDPVLQKARPTVTDLKWLLADVRPVVQELVPASKNLTSVFDDVRGPVLQRITGPLMKWLLNSYHGTGQYFGSGGDEPVYQAAVFAVANFGQGGERTDAYGPNLAFHIGVNHSSVMGLPISVEQLITQLTGIGVHGPVEPGVHTPKSPDAKGPQIK